MLDLQTIFIFSCGVSLFIIAVTTTGWLRAPSRRDGRFWTMSAWLALAGPAILAGGESLPYHGAGYLGGLACVASTGFMHLGFKEFYGQHARIREVSYIAFAAMVALLLRDYFTDGSVIDIAVIYVAIAANLTWVARTVWRGRAGEVLPSRHVATVIISIYAAAALTVAPFAFFDPVKFSAGMPVSLWMAVSTILLVLLNLATYVLMLALTLERLIESQRELANMDVLTRAMNRRAFYERLPGLSGASGVLAIIDLDHFKSINDTYGHQAGDEVLRNLSNVAKVNLPAGASFGRLGGEEFGICLPGYSASAAHALLDDLRAEFERLEFRSTANPPFSATFSCGYTCFEAHGWEVDTKLAEADSALYAAKDSTRNVVVAFDPSARLKRQSTQEGSRPTANLVKLSKMA